jgi:arginase
MSEVHLGAAPRNGAPASRFLLPWHIFDPLPDDLGTGRPLTGRRPGPGPSTQFVRSRPGSTGVPWADLVDLYRPLRDAVGKLAAPGHPVVVVSGDCVASLAVLAGVQGAGAPLGLVWFDAHADFHTEQTTTSGYLGGLPLAKAVGRGDRTLPDGLGLEPLPEASVTLVGARDLDPPEVAALADSAVRRVPLDELVPALPDGRVVVHVDLDVVDPDRLPGVRFPAPGGPGQGEVVEAVRSVLAARRVVALDVAATWAPHRVDPGPAGALLRSMVDLLA